ncbi:MAG: ferric reductase-like transmembrane domain-containing protein [Pseudomonadota bacterium]
MARTVAIWVALAAVIAWPVAIAATSPLLAYRDAIYIAASFTGIGALVLLLVQPLLIGGFLPGLNRLQERRLHRGLGPALVGLIVLHVAALYLTSPPDVVDALLLRSPTPFSVWGVAAMAAAFAVAGSVALRRRLRLRTWRLLHNTLVVVLAVGTVVHAMLIEGAMGTWTKTLLCALVLVAVAVVTIRLWRPRAS